MPANHVGFLARQEAHHSVIWDKKNKEVLFDPAVGVVPTSQIFKLCGEQAYSGTLGFMGLQFSTCKTDSDLGFARNDGLK